MFFFFYAAPGLPPIFNLQHPTPSTCPRIQRVWLNVLRTACAHTVPTKVGKSQAIHYVSGITTQIFLLQLKCFMSMSA